jgi:hypothetical protein
MVRCLPIAAPIQCPSCQHFTKRQQLTKAQFLVLATALVCATALSETDENAGWHVFSCLFFQTRVAKKIVIAQQNPQHQTFTIAIEIKVE